MLYRNPHQAAGAPAVDVYGAPTGVPFPRYQADAEPGTAPPAHQVLLDQAKAMTLAYYASLPAHCLTVQEDAFLEGRWRPFDAACEAARAAGAPVPRHGDLSDPRAAEAAMRPWLSAGRAHRA